MIVSTSYFLAVLMSIVMGGKTLALFQRPSSARNKQEKTTNNSDKALHNKWELYNLMAGPFQVECLKPVVVVFQTPIAINTTLNHCASEKPKPTAGLMRQNSTTKRDRPARIR